MSLDDVRHRNDIWWHDAPLPRRWHKCSTWTRGWTGYFTLVHRCACGAISFNGREWDERNSRRRSSR